MELVHNPFEQIDPLIIYLRFEKIIKRIDNKQHLLEIGKLLEEALKKV